MTLSGRLGALWGYHAVSVFCVRGVGFLCFLFSKARESAIFPTLTDLSVVFPALSVASFPVTELGPPGLQPASSAYARGIPHRALDERDHLAYRGRQTPSCPGGHRVSRVSRLAPSTSKGRVGIARTKIIIWRHPRCCSMRRKPCRVVPSCRRPAKVPQAVRARHLLGPFTLYLVRLSFSAFFSGGRRGGQGGDFEGRRGGAR